MLSAFMLHIIRFASQPVKFHQTAFFFVDRRPSDAFVQPTAAVAIHFHNLSHRIFFSEKNIF